jgi:hypothetical protein
MTEIPDRESALSRDLAGVNCALVKIVDADDRYYVLVGDPELCTGMASGLRRRTCLP